MSALNLFKIAKVSEEPSRPGIQRFELRPLSYSLFEKITRFRTLYFKVELVSVPRPIPEEPK